MHERIIRDSMGPMARSNITACSRQERKEENTIVAELQVEILHYQTADMEQKPGMRSRADEWNVQNDFKKYDIVPKWRYATLKNAV